MYRKKPKTVRNTEIPLRYWTRRISSRNIEILQYYSCILQFLAAWLKMFSDPETNSRISGTTKIDIPQNMTISYVFTHYRLIFIMLKYLIKFHRFHTIVQYTMVHVGTQCFICCNTCSEIVNRFFEEVIKCSINFMNLPFKLTCSFLC